MLSPIQVGRFGLVLEFLPCTQDMLAKSWQDTGYLHRDSVCFSSLSVQELAWNLEIDHDLLISHSCNLSVVPILVSSAFGCVVFLNCDGRLFLLFLILIVNSEHLQML
jgi:hypothetical protein